MRCLVRSRPCRRRRRLRSGTRDGTSLSRQPIPSAIAPTTDDATRDPETRTILLIGFDPDLGQTMKEILALEGYRTDDVPRGIDPLDRVRGSPPSAIVVYAPTDLRRYCGIPNIFVDLAAADATRSSPVVALCVTWESVELARASRNVVATVEGRFDLESLLRAIRQAVIASGFFRPSS